MQPDWWEVTHPGVGTNRYAYSFNDPVNLSDPNGNIVPVIAALALIGILAADAANAPGPESEIVNDRPLEDALGVLLPVEEIQDAANGDVSMGTVLGAAPQSRFPKKVFGWLKKKKRGATNNGANGQTGFSGSRGNPLENPVFQPSRNTPAIIGDRTFTGHALDQMQNRGIPPSVVEDAISPSNLVGAGNRLGTSVYYSGTNGVRVITNSNRDVVTVITAPRQ